jgi:hypothetical protein
MLRTPSLSRIDILYNFWNQAANAYNIFSLSVIDILYNFGN